METILPCKERAISVRYKLYRQFCPFQWTFWFKYCSIATKWLYLLLVWLRKRRPQRYFGKIYFMHLDGDCHTSSRTSTSIETQKYILLILRTISTGLESINEIVWTQNTSASSFKKSQRRSTVLWTSMVPVGTTKTTSRYFIRVYQTMNSIHGSDSTIIYWRMIYVNFSR